MASWVSNDSSISAKLQHFWKHFLLTFVLWKEYDTQNEPNNLIDSFYFHQTNTQVFMLLLIKGSFQNHCKIDPYPIFKFIDHTQACNPSHTNM